MKHFCRTRKTKQHVRKNIDFNLYFKSFHQETDSRGMWNNKVQIFWIVNANNCIILLWGMEFSAIDEN